MFSNASERNSGKQNGSTVLLSTHTSGKQHLSQPRGQHSVGFMDIMTPGGTESGTFMRLYYPTDEQCIEEHERWPVWAYEDKYDHEKDEPVTQYTWNHIQKVTMLALTFSVGPKRCNGTLNLK